MPDKYDMGLGLALSLKVSNCRSH